MNTYEEVQKQIAALQSGRRTPRTDAELARLGYAVGSSPEWAHFARQLENDLTSVQAQLAQSEAARHEAIASEHAISAAYVRLRVKLQALDLPPGSTPEQIRAHTEARLEQVLRDRSIQETAQLNPAHA